MYMIRSYDNMLIHELINLHDNWFYDTRGIIGMVWMTVKKKRVVS